MGKADQALRDAETAIQLDPKFWKAFSRKGDALDAMSKFESAIQAYSRSLEINPENQLAAKSLADVKEKLQRKSVREEKEMNSMGLNDFSDWLKKETNRVLTLQFQEFVEEELVPTYLSIRGGFEEFFANLPTARKEEILNKSEKILATMELPGAKSCLQKMREVCMSGVKIIQWFDILSFFASEAAEGKKIADLLLTPLLVLQPAEEIRPKISLFLNINDEILEKREEGDLDNNIIPNLESLLKISKIYFQGYFSAWLEDEKKKETPLAFREWSQCNQALRFCRRCPSLEDFEAQIGWNPIHGDAAETFQDVKREITFKEEAIKDSFTRLSRDPQFGPLLVQSPHAAIFSLYLERSQDFYSLASSLAFYYLTSQDSSKIVDEIDSIIFRFLEKTGSSNQIKKRAGEISQDPNKFVDLIRSLANLLSIKEKAIGSLVQKPHLVDLLIETLVLSLKETDNLSRRISLSKLTYQLLRSLAAIGRYPSSSLLNPEKLATAMIHLEKSNPRPWIQGLMSRVSSLTQQSGCKHGDDILVRDIEFQQQEEKEGKEEKKKISSKDLICCANCQKNLAETEIKRCGKCFKVIYCSRGCQVNDWKIHKPSCVM